MSNVTIQDCMDQGGTAKIEEALRFDSKGHPFLRSTAPAKATSGNGSSKELYFQRSADQNFAWIKQGSLPRKPLPSQTGDIRLDYLVLRRIGADFVTRMENGVLFSTLGYLSEYDKESWWISGEGLVLSSDGAVAARHFTPKTEVQNKKARGFVRVRAVNYGNSGGLQVKMGSGLGQWVRLYISMSR